MLKELIVRNFALINHAHIHFKKTFVAITGETGAGKSILLDALSLALGEKSTSSVLFDKTKKCIIEAIFDISELQLHHFFETNELDYQPETILRREISADGKSRSFINDTPVNTSTLKLLGQQLIDIHSQHQNLILNSTAFRYNFIDAIAHCLNEQKKFAQSFKDYQKQKKELNELLEQQQSATKETDYLKFLLSELKEANIQEGELQSLEEEFEQLQNAESIIQQLTSSIHVLKDAEINAIQLLQQAKNNLQNISRFQSKYDELAQRLQSAIVEIKDIADESENLLSNIEINHQKIETISEKIDTINKLIKKHNVKTDKELLQIQSDTEIKLSQFQNIDDQIEEKNNLLKQLEQQILQMANILSEKRKSVKNKIEKECTTILKELSMPNAQFIIDIQKKSEQEVNEFGQDEIKFLFSANKGIPATELQKTASGGEMSRLMLAIKSMIVQKIQLPVIIFDEIDTGVSGAVAARMGEIMKKISENMQVMAITHLPQIAAKAHQHLFVNKEEFQNKTISKITELKEEERIMEIAKMLSSGTPGEAAIQNAKELLLQ